MYGDSCGGKTTVSNLLYHLLDSEPSAGHRSFISRVSLSQFQVAFEDANSVGAVRDDATTGSFEMRVASISANRWSGGSRTCVRTYEVGIASNS